MSRLITVGNETFEYPDNRENPGWGTEATDTIEAIADVLSDVRGPNDIGSTSFSISTFGSSTNITSLNFSSSAVRAAIIEYSIFRSYATPPATRAECGTIHAAYDGTTWSLARMSVGDAQVEFDITAAGQITINASVTGVFTGTAVSNVIKFRARTFPQ